jgi:DNA-binding XRE family transcriptional regulator
MKLAEQIVAFRAQWGLTQAEVADLVDVHKDTIFAWEKGENEPKGVRRRRLMAVLAGGDPYAQPPQADLQARILQALEQMSEADKAAALAAILRIRESRRA